MTLMQRPSLGPGNKGISGKESRALPNRGIVDVEMFFNRDNSNCKHRSPCAETPSVPVTQPLATCQCCEINKMARGRSQRLPTAANGLSLIPDRPIVCQRDPAFRLATQ